MTQLIRWTAPVVFAACSSVACGGNDEPGEALPSGSATPSVTPRASDGTSGAAAAGQPPAQQSPAEQASSAAGTASAQTPVVACDAPAPRILLTGTRAFSLSADNDFVYFVDPEAGPSDALQPSGAVKRVSIASGEVSTVFEPSEPQHIAQMRRSGDQLFLLMADTSPDATGGFIFRLPTSGGTPTRLGPVGDEGYAIDFPNFAAVSDSFAYMVASDNLWEVTLADGSERIAAQAPDISRPQLFDGVLWFATAFGGGDIYRIDATLAGAQAALALPGGCGGGSPASSSTYLVSDDGVLCGAVLSIDRLPLGGGEREIVWSIPFELAGGEASPVRVEDGRIYVVSGRLGATLAVAGGAPEFFACEGLTVDAVTTNDTSIIYGRGGFGPGFPFNQVSAPSEFTEIAIVPK